MRFVLIFFLFIGISSLSFAQTSTIKGVLKKANSEDPLTGIEVGVQGTDLKTETGPLGYFQLSDIPIGEQVIYFSENDIILKTTTILLGEKEYDMGSLSTTKSREESEDIIPTITLNENEIDQAEDLSDSNISGLLTASRDIFVNTAAFNWGVARFRIRGYDSENTMTYLNGVPVNDMESGRVYWSIWGGLNDATRRQETNIGLGNIRYSIGGIGGAANIDTRASTFRKGLRVSYANSNRTYSSRVMATYATGMMNNGWAFAVSGSRRWANEGYVEGTFYDAYSYFLSIDRKLGENHTLNLTAFGAPNKRGKAIASIQRYYDLLDNNYYNPWWGYQNGEKRNSRVANAHQPWGILRHDWQISDAASVSTSVSYSTGRNGGTAVERFKGNDPDSDDYKNDPFLISNDSMSNVILDQIRANPALVQMDWDHFYEVNRNSQFTDEDARGLGLAPGEVTGLRAQYFVEDRRYDAEKANFNMVYENLLGENVNFNFGLYYNHFKGHNFKVMEDLLGGDFYVDLNRFQLGAGDAMQNDLQNPNRFIEEGDEFGYNYYANINKMGSWTQALITTKLVDFNVAIDLSQTKFWRTGVYQNGLFPDNSLGDSEKQSFFNYSVKGGMMYKVDGRNYIFANAQMTTRAPFFRNSYTSVRTRDDLVPNLTDTKILGGELGYKMNSPNLKIRANLYYTRFEDETKINFFVINDGAGSTGFGSYVISDIDKVHMGTELAIEYKLAPGLKAKAVAAIGQHYYNNRPTAYAFTDELEGTLFDPATVYLEKYKLDGSPQSAYTFSLDYRDPKFWFATLSFNYFNRNWISVTPERHRAVAVEAYTPDSPEWNAVLEQEEYASAYTVDLFAGKSFKVKGNMFIYLTLGVNNILNTQDFKTGGFEQLRFAGDEDLDRFPSKYFYAYGRNYFASVTFNLR